MKIKSHICCPYSEELASELKKRRISFNGSSDPLTGASELIVFDAVGLEDRTFLPPDTVIIDSPVFTRRELEAADWLTCRCTSAKVELENEEASFYCTEVYDGGAKANHRFLSGRPFYAGSAPKHRETQGFFSSYLLSDYQLFCSERAKGALLSSFPELAVSFEPVLSSKTGKPLGDLYYINVQSILRQPIDLSGSEEYRCPSCGRVSYGEPMQLKVKGELPDASLTMLKTPDLFSSGGNFTYPMLLVSQSLKRVLEKNRLTRGLIFAPVARFGE